MADELDPVEQTFIANMLPYLDEIQRGVDDAREFAAANLEASAGIDDMRDHAAEAGAAIGDLRDHAAEAKEADNMLRDSAIEAGEALGHVRDESLEASASVKELGDSADETAAKLDLMGLSGASTFSSLGPLLGIIGALVIAGAAVAPAFAAAGLGIGAFGAFAIPAIHEVTTGLTTISTAEQAVQNATTAAARNTALKQLRQDWANMPAPIAATVKQIQAFEAEFTNLAKSSGIQNDVLGDITRVLGIARELLPEIVPLAQAGARAIGGMLSTLSTGLQSSGFRSFLQLMTSMVVPAVQAITRLAGVILGVLGNALTSLAPLSIPFINFLSVLVGALGGPVVAALHVIIALFLGLATALEPLLPGLSQFATTLINDIGSSFEEFVPLLTQVVQLLGGAFLKILRDLEPVAANALTPNSPFMSALGIIPGVLRVILPLITGLASILAQPFFARAAVDIISAVIAFRALQGALGLARTGFALLTAVMELNPFVLILTGIALLVVAFAELWTHSAAFRNFWEGLWRDITGAVRTALDWIRSNWPLLLGILTGPIGLAVYYIVSHWNQITAGAARMVSEVTGWFERLPGYILNAVSNFGSLLWNAGVQVVWGLIKGVEAEAGQLFSYIANIAHSISSFFSSALGILSPSRVFYEHGVNTMLGYINGIKAAAPQVRAAMAAVGGQIAAGGLPGVTGSSTSAAPSVHVTMPVTMQGTAQLYNTSAFLQYLQAAVQEAILRYQLNNPSNGLNLAGRL